jgi:hypothetical protein
MDSNELHRQTLEQFKSEIVAKKLELGKCIQKQEDLETGIAKLQEVAVAIARLLGEEYVPEDAMGLTDAIRQAFKTTPNVTMTTKEVRARLQQMGFDITQYGNVLASIHTVISRLHSKREIKQAAVRNDGKPAYQWVNPLPPPPTPLPVAEAAKAVLAGRKK